MYGKFIDATALKWGTAEKTAHILFKPAQSVVPDARIRSKIILDTIEGYHPLDENTVICLGAAGDVWQQQISKLVTKYSIVSSTSDGWMWCTPLPGVPNDVYEVTANDLGNGNDTFHVSAQWGINTDNGPIQVGKVGDFILRDPNNHNDVWLVQRKIFLNTY